jgi:S-DNA-T family DNA segregation ATPase FtsK/SpoIIIE
VLRRIVKGAAGPGRALVLGGSADDLCGGLSNWQVEAKKARQGALLSPQGLSDGDLIGARVPRSSVGAPVQPGRALLHLGDGQLVTVQVPSS